MKLIFNLTNINLYISISKCYKNSLITKKIFQLQKASILRTMDNMKLFESGVKKGHVFITLHDCVLTCERLVRGNFANPETPDSMESRPGYPGFDSLAL